LTKSQKLYPLPGVTSLLSQAQRKLNNESMNGNSASSASGAGSASSSNRNGNSNGYSNMNGTSTRSSNSSDYQRSNSTTSNASSSNNSNASFRHPSQRQSSTASTASAPSSSASSSSASSTPSSASASSARTGTDGRTYTPAQEKLVQQILKAKEGGRGAHYRVLGIESNADENAIKKAYRKAALKLHPDKNSAPQADDAFKAVGLAYATLSDSQKRTIYDRYGEEDPDNTGGGMGRRGGGGVHFNGQNMNPEDIFNAFFGGGGGGMPGGGGMHFRAGGMPGGFRVYSTNGGFGGMPRGGMPGQRGQQQQRQEPQNPIMQLVQLLPILMLVLMSFFNLPGEQANGKTGGNQYFSLTVSLRLF
jgi:DnaJ family protein B protein 12